MSCCICYSYGEVERSQFFPPQLSHLYFSSAEMTDFLVLVFLLQLQEKQRLIDFAEALRSKLNYFDELENVRFDCWLYWSFS